MNSPIRVKLSKYKKELQTKCKNSMRRLNRKWYIAIHRPSVIVEVPIDICMNPLGFSFGPGGWHHLVALLKEYDQNPYLHPEESVLYRFYQKYQPLDMGELLDQIGYSPSFRPPFFVYPWGSFKASTYYKGATPKNQRNSRFSGPADEWRLNTDFCQTIRLYQQIKKEGYRPWIRDFIGGVFLQSASGEQRYVVLDGNHRVAVLAHLGMRQVRTAYLKGHFKIIHELEVDEWHYVRNGMCSRADALAYFHAFFQLSGRERSFRYELTSYTDY